MKKAFIYLLAGCFLLVATAATVSAAPNIGLDQNGMTTKIAGSSGYDPTTNQLTLSATIGRIVKIILTLVGTIFFVLTVYAGILWMTAGGNEEAVTKATTILKTAIIGLIITLAAYSITYFITAAVVRSTLPVAAPGP